MIYCSSTAVFYVSNIFCQWILLVKFAWSFIPLHFNRNLPFFEQKLRLFIFLSLIVLRCPLFQKGAANHVLTLIIKDCLYMRIFFAGHEIIQVHQSYIKPLALYYLAFFTIIVGLKINTFNLHLLNLNAIRTSNTDEFMSKMIYMM